MHIFQKKCIFFVFFINTDIFCQFDVVILHRQTKNETIQRFLLTTKNYHYATRIELYSSI